MKIRFLENLTSDLENDNYNFENIFPNYSLVNFLKSGAKIHIKEKNKGSFTEYCDGKVTDECILRGKNSSDPAIRKKAVFALNARAWKHLDGGFLSKLFNNRENANSNFKSNFKSNYDDYDFSQTNYSFIPGIKTPIAEFLVSDNYFDPLKKKKEKTLEELLGINDDNIISYSKINPILNSSPTWMEDVIDKEEKEDKEKEEKKKKKDEIPEVFNKGRLGMKFQYGGYIGLYFTKYTPFTKESNNNSILENNYPTIDNSLVFEEESSPSEYEKLKETKDSEIPSFFNLEISNSSEEINPKITKGERYKKFKQYLDECIEEDPSAAKYEKVLTDIAYHESRFNYSISNTAGAPAYGYFQFWCSPSLNNIKYYSGLSKDDFIKNPKAQIKAAIKMAKDIETKFTKRDLQLANQKGYNMNCLIRGAWLGGVGGVRQVLNGTGNPSDAKWYHGKSKGHSVKDAMEEQKHNIL